MKMIYSILLFVIAVQIFFQYKLSCQISEASPIGQYLGCSTILNFIVFGVLGYLLYLELRYTNEN
jgi:hypothetical protein